MSKCLQCDTPVAFSAVLNTVNPFKVKCKQCQEVILLDKLSASLAVFIILSVSAFLLMQVENIENNLWYVGLPLAISIEVIYFILIRFKLIKVKLHKKS